MRASDSRPKQMLRTASALAFLTLAVMACAPGTTPPPTARPAVPPELALFNGTLIDGIRRRPS
jgi:hypothetical protein